MIRILLIDDEPLALRQLEMYVSKVPFLERVASCHSAAAAVPFLDKTDTMLVDINMPDLSGLDFVRSLERPPLFIFTTAYSEFALEGFRVNAVDYLLKPFSFNEFLTSMERLKERFEMMRATSPEMEILSFRTDRRTVLVSPDSIRYVESMSEYIKVHLSDTPEPLVVLYSLRRLSEQLPSDRFLRIHRSYLVNLSRIRSAGTGSVILDDGTQLPVSDLYRPSLKAFLKG